MPIRAAQPQKRLAPYPEEGEPDKDRQIRGEIEPEESHSNTPKKKTRLEPKEQLDKDQRKRRKQNKNPADFLSVTQEPI